MWNKRILIYFILIIGILISLFHASEWLWPELWGSRSLGNNLYLINWEKGAKIVVYCKNPRGNTCYSGSYVVPAGPVSATKEDVREAVTSEHYIIILSYLIEQDKYKYYVISKEYGELNNPPLEIREKFLYPFEDYSHFSNKCDSLGIHKIIPLGWQKRNLE